jgi:hypothetical protein
MKYYKQVNNSRNTDNYSTSISQEGNANSASLNRTEVYPDSINTNSLIFSLVRCTMKLMKCSGKTASVSRLILVRFRMNRSSRSHSALSSSSSLSAKRIPKPIAPPVDPKVPPIERPIRNITKVNRVCFTRSGDYVGRFPLNRFLYGQENDRILICECVLSSSSLLNYIQKFTIIEDRLNLLKRFNVSAINKGTLLNNVGRVCVRVDELMTFFSCLCLLTSILNLNSILIFIPFIHSDFAVNTAVSDQSLRSSCSLQ